MNKLTDEQIDSIVDVLEENRVDTLDNAKENTVVNPDAELEAVSFDSNSDDEFIHQIDMISKTVDDFSNVDIFEAANPEVEQKTFINNAKSGFDLSDEEAMSFISLIDSYRKNNNIPIYEALPNSLKDNINKILIELGKGIEYRESVSKVVLDEFIKDSEVDSVFVDLEKSLHEALKIPSIVDLYSEHTKTVMEKNLPEMVEKIKDQEPEKAELLLKIKDVFKKSYELTELKDLYENNSVARKFIRKSDIEFNRSLSNLNNANSKTKFKMYDVFEIPKALYKVLCDDPKNIKKFYEEDNIDVPDNISRLVDLNITENDIKKFSTLIAISCKNLDPYNIVDASYMYYLTKNIIMLRHTQESKTDFAAELINNICDIITLIRTKEAEFYEQNPHLLKSKHSKKSHSANSGKK